MKYIHNIKYSPDTTYFAVYRYLILIFTITSFAIFEFNCTKKEIKTKDIDQKYFVTKKDANLYGDILERNIIDEIPAFIKIETMEKATLEKDDKTLTFFKIYFNNKEGWIQSVYLADIKNDSLNSQKTNQDFKKQVNIKRKTKKPSQNNNKIKKEELSFFVQLGSFRDKNNATNLINDLKSSGFMLNIDEIKTKTGVLHRVKTASFPTKIEAQNVIDSLFKNLPNLKPLLKPNSHNRINNKSIPALKKLTKTEYYTIQISSFKNKNSAGKLAKKLSDAGFYSEVSEAWVNEIKWYRVHHGQYKMIAMAKKVSKELKSKFNFNTWISNIYR